MNMIVFFAVYLAVGFLFMTYCAKFGWMDKYDPPFFYWIGWPSIILYALFKLLSSVFGSFNTVLQNYVNSLKPEQTEN